MVTSKLAASIQPKKDVVSDGEESITIVPERVPSPEGGPSPQVSRTLEVPPARERANSKGSSQVSSPSDAGKRQPSKGRESPFRGIPLVVQLARQNSGSSDQMNNREPSKRTEPALENGDAEAAPNVVSTAWS